jgi:hypothetical protein
MKKEKKLPEYFKYNEYVEDIYVLFAKMGGKYPEFLCRPYQEVMCDIAVTHSPRYLIDMKLEAGETIIRCANEKKKEVANG